MSLLLAKHSWESVLVQIVEGLENGTVQLPEEAPAMNPADIRKRMQLRDLLDRPFIPFRILTNDGRTFEVKQPELLMPGESALIIGSPSERDPRTFSTFEVVEWRNVRKIEL